MIFDVEADGLLDEATTIHVLSYRDKGKVKHTHDYEEMRRILLSQRVLIGHNIICYDIPLLEKLLNIKIKAELIDTLALSWYLNHQRIRHGLEVYGEEFGVPKPQIDDWHSLTPEEYAHRCDEDVKINYKLWLQLKKKLLDLYGTKESADRMIKYLTFKMECIREQERSGWKLDVSRATSVLNTLYEQRDEKIQQLILAMPTVKKYVTKTKPKKPYKADGSFSVLGAKWFKLLRDNNLPDDYTGEVKVFHHEEEPNPSSHDQIKSWLYELGWVPISFKFDKDSDGNERKIPQVRIDGEDGKELCPSVLKLSDKYPEVKLLEGLSVINHRISIFEGFLKNHKNGWLKATAAGLTNTLRFKHRVLVNLPGVDKPWGEDIRGCLIAPDGYELCGSDMCSLEDMTKRHYMYEYDPDYVEEMSRPGFDPHLDLAKFAKFVTQQEIDDWQQEVEGARNLKPIRKNFKVTNYSATYGVQPPKLSRTADITLSEAKKLLKAFWDRNWAIQAVAKNTVVKKVNGEMWLYNPVSRLWYSLRYEKDIFSTLNQGTGVFCFDSWIRQVRKRRSQLTGQFHDEICLAVKRGQRDYITKILKDSINEVNKKLNLNVKLDVDIQFGDTYADVH